MTIADITTLITTVGFPIAMCLLIYYQDQKKLTALQEAINKNTEAITKLITKLEGKVDDANLS